jgi:2-polyprenyl-3-methyl-5-hydroxy-6-metoxy-1,4-benzoquinol methylase
MNKPRASSVGRRTLSQAKRFLMITEDGFPSSQMGNITHRIITMSGHEVIRAMITHKYYLPITPNKDLSRHHIEIFNDYPSLSAPRLSLNDYHALCGDDLDFNKIGMKDDWRYTRFNEDVESLNPENKLVQRLRGTAWRIESLIQAIQPDGLFIQQGCSPESLIMLSKGLSSRLPVFIMETGFLPGHVYFELYGMHFYRSHCRIDNLYHAGELEIDAEAAAALRQKIRDNILNHNISKYQQTVHESEIQVLEDFVKRFQGRVIFFPEQVPLDSNVFSALRELGISSLEAIYRRVVDSLPADMGLVFKRHPKWMATDRNDLMRGNVLFLDSLALSDIFRRVKAVVTLTSNVGLEAATCDLPVLCLGASIYSGKGFTLDWDGEADLTSCLRKAFDFRPNEDAVASFLYTLKKEVLFSPEEPPEDFNLLCQGDEFTPAPDPRAPFWKEGRGDFVGFYNLKESYTRLYRKNFSYPEIMVKLGRQPMSSPSLHLSSGERQTAAQINQIDSAHVLRYYFAGLLLPSEGKILDACCGIAYGANYLAAQTCAQVLAFDYSDEAIYFANEAYAAPNITYRAMSAGAFEASDVHEVYGPFDLVTTFECLEHIPSPETLVGQIKKRMSADGVFIGSVPHNEVIPLGDHPFHIRHYDLPSLKAVLDIQSDEHVRFYFQNDAHQINLDPSAGGTIIFVLSKDENKLRTLDGQIPFRPTLPVRETTELFFPAFLFSVGGTDRVPIEGIPLVTNSPGSIFWGPYQAIPAGDWEVNFLFTVPDSHSVAVQNQNYSLTLDIVSSQGRIVYFRQDFTVAELLKNPKAMIRVESPEEFLEFRAYAHGSISSGLNSDGLLFKGVRLSRLAGSSALKLSAPKISGGVIPQPLLPYTRLLRFARLCLCDPREAWRRLKEKIKNKD